MTTATWVLHQGENLAHLRHMETDSVDLVCTDPPYFSQRNWRGDSGAFSDTWESRDAFVDAMRLVAVELHRVLKPEGTLYWQCDDNANHVLRLMLEDVWGVDNFVSEIVWERTYGAKSGASWPRIKDHILMFGNRVVNRDAVSVPLSEETLARDYCHYDDLGRYRINSLVPCGFTADAARYSECTLSAPNNTRARNAPWRGIVLPPNRMWNAPTNLPPWFDRPDGWDKFTTHEKLDEMDRQGLIVWPKTEGARPMFKLYLCVSRGEMPTNIWRNIILPNSSHERVGYPTQKPAKLYERMVLASSAPGDTVLDPFCGSGTTLIAAYRHGRDAIGIDRNNEAIILAMKRFEDERGSLL